MKMFPIVVISLLSSPFAGVSAQGVNDAQIASIVVTANQVDIDAGKLAASRATSAEVRTFAQLMVTDHTSVNRSATELAARLKVTPQDNPTSQSLKSGGDKNLAHLKTLKGAAFDKAYVDHEVAYHQQVIDALDKVLIPGATNAELKALLVKVRPAFVAHLEHAKRLQSARSTAAGDRSRPKTHTVTIEGVRFLPEVLTVAPGDTIVWVNKDLVPHTATSTAGSFDSGDIQANRFWKFKARKAGDFPYTCTFHPTMKAMLRIRS